MGFWDSLKQTTGNMSANLQGQLSKYRNSNFADASMATCALIAAADGSIDPEERRKTAKFIMNSDMLKAFDVSQLKTKFDTYCNKVEDDYDFGKIDLLQTIGKVKRDPDQARAVVQVGIIVGGADGNFDDDEKKAVREICNTLGIAPSEYDL